GGTISGNTASDYGGGVFVQSLNMTGGSIYGNSAKFGGAVVFNTTFNMTGGSISANKAVTGKGLYLVEGDFYLGGSGFVNEDNDVWVKENNVINVTTPLTSGGVRSITPARDTAQTVVRISDGNNASKYLSNFGLNPDYAKSANQNSLSASGFTITTSHKASPAPTPDNGGNGITYLGDVLYSVAFDYTNDSGITDVYNLKYGSKVERPEDPARSGYRFIGWQNAFGYEWDFENDVIEASIILYAQWERVYSPAIPIATDTPKSPVPAAGIILGMFVLALFISLRKQ
ncbi:MAG: InlB B-repeat-containing protein, partial [Methanocorpusculum sp.]|nr:InlB B-repeat-containing protein [Methanocorpusculum sp.]